MRNLLLAALLLIPLTACANPKSPVQISEAKADEAKPECTDPGKWLNAVKQNTAEIGTMHVAQLQPAETLQAVAAYNEKAEGNPIAADTAIIVGFDRDGKAMPVLIIGLFKDGCMVGGLVRRPVPSEGA
jgi:hypothetical protein